MKKIFQFLREIFSEWSRDKALNLGAALSYYTVFSLPPLLAIIIAIAGLAFGHETVQGQIVSQIQELVGPQSAGVINAMIEGAYKHRGAQHSCNRFWRDCAALQREWSFSPASIFTECHL